VEARKHYIKGIIVVEEELELCSKVADGASSNAEENSSSYKTGGNQFPEWTE
jgi:hypothetical protein